MRTIHVTSATQILLFSLKKKGKEKKRKKENCLTIVSTFSNIKTGDHDHRRWKLRTLMEKPNKKAKRAAKPTTATATAGRKS